MEVIFMKINLNKDLNKLSLNLEIEEKETTKYIILKWLLRVIPPITGIITLLIHLLK